MNIKQEQGFSILAVVLVVAVVIAAGLIVWRVLDSNKPATNQQTSDLTGQQEQANQPAADPNEGYVVIREWGVRFRVVEGLNDLTYGLDGERVVFSTATLEKFGASCGTGAESLRPLGQLTRTTAEQEVFTSESGAFVKKIDGYYFRYTTPQTACSGDTAASDLQTRTSVLFKDSVSTLEPSEPSSR